MNRNISTKYSHLKRNSHRRRERFYTPGGAVVVGVGGGVTALIGGTAGRLGASGAAPHRVACDLAGCGQKRAGGRRAPLLK